MSIDSSQCTNAATLADGQFTADDVYAVIDIVTGFGKEAGKIVDGIDSLRSGKDVRVESVTEARNILDNMPELKPGPGNLMPGLRDRSNTYRGDLINKSDPTSSAIHPAGKHANQPHFNVDIKDSDGVRQKPAIFIDNK